MRQRKPFSNKTETIRTVIRLQDLEEVATAFPDSITDRLRRYYPNHGTLVVTAIEWIDTPNQILQFFEEYTYLLALTQGNYDRDYRSMHHIYAGFKLAATKTNVNIWNTTLSEAFTAIRNKRLTHSVRSKTATEEQ